MSIVSSGQILTVSSGQTVSGNIVLNGGLESVLLGGHAISTTISSGGRETVALGGAVSGTLIASGGTNRVLAGGTASGTTVQSGGIDVVFGTATSDTIQAGGSAFVSSGGVLSGATLSGGFLEIASGGAASTSQIGFTSAGGTLQLDDSQHFNGVISGLGVPGGIDLRDIAFGTGTMLGYTGDTSSGTLTVSDGSHTATLTLLGQYTAGNFTTQADGHGGTLITDPPVQGLAGSPYVLPHS